MSDYAAVLGRMAELMVEGTHEATVEMVALVRSHAATDELRAKLDALAEKKPRHR